MSLTHPHKLYSSPPPPLPTYGNQTTDIERSTMQLPPMSSLLPRNEQLNGPERKPFRYPPAPFQPHGTAPPPRYREMNPSGPSPKYNPPPSRGNYPSSSQAPAYPSQVSGPPQQTISPIQYEAPLDQRRQAKKISQRKEVIKADQDRANAAARESIYTIPPFAVANPVLQHHPEDRRPSISTNPAISPRDTHRRPSSMANLLSPRSRYV